MKFLADMAISQSTVLWLRQQGHDAYHVRDEGMQRSLDQEILAKARAEERILLTLDLDFGYLMAVSGAVLPSLIIFRLGNETATAVTHRLEEALACCEKDLLAGALVTVDDNTIRVRQLPINRD
jgi:predicted nuclease of predicted toxin-antitoxin system